MPICQNCKREWTWKQTMRTLFRLKCPYCEKKQYETASSKKRTSTFSFIPLIALPITILFHLPWWFIGIFMIPMILVLWSVYPYIIKLSNVEEPLW